MVGLGAAYSRSKRHMNGIGVLHTASLQPHAPPYSWLELAARQFSLPARLFGSDLLVDRSTPQWV